MEDIEYLEEYEDLVLPGMSKQSKTPIQHTADGEDSSSIDQDIFESLFDSRSDDETVVQKKDPKLNRREDRSSLDSLDMLVKDLGEQLPTSTDLISQTVEESSSSKPAKTITKGQPKKEEKSQEFQTKLGIKNKSNLERLGKGKSVATVKPTVQNQNEQEMISSTSRSANVQSTTINPSIATTSRKFSTPTSSTSVNKKKDPVQTIIKPEKQVSKDPADDPLAGIDSDTESDLLGSASYTFSDMSDADESYLSLSDIDNEDEPQLLDDLDQPIENLDQIEIPTVYNSSGTTTFNAHNIEEQASSSVTSNITQSRNVSNRSEKEKITILSNKVLDRLDTSLLESLTGVSSKISMGLDTKIETGTLNSVLHEIVEALPEQEKSISTTDTTTTDTTTVMRFDDVTTTTQDVTAVASEASNIFNSNFNSSENLIKETQESNDIYFVSTKKISEQSNVTTTIIESKTNLEQYSVTDSLCDVESNTATTCKKVVDCDSNNKKNISCDTEGATSSKDIAKTTKDSKVTKKDNIAKTEDKSLDIGVSELKDILLNESVITSEYNEDAVTTLQEIKDIYDEIDTQQKTNQIKEGKGTALDDMKNKSSAGEAILTESISTKDLKSASSNSPKQEKTKFSIAFKKANSKVLKKDFAEMEKLSEEKLKATRAIKKTLTNDGKECASQINKKNADKSSSSVTKEVTNRTDKDKNITLPESKTDIEDNEGTSDNKGLKNVKSTTNLNISKTKKNETNNEKKVNVVKSSEDTNTADSKDAKNLKSTLLTNTSKNDKTNEEKQITSQEIIKESEINKKSTLDLNTPIIEKTNKEKPVTSLEVIKESEVNKKSTVTLNMPKNEKTNKEKQITSQEAIKEAEINKNISLRSKDTLNLKSKINSPKKDKTSASDNKKVISKDVKRFLDVNETNTAENKETTNIKSKESSKSSTKLVKVAQTNEDKKVNSKEVKKDADDKKVTPSDNKDVKNLQLKTNTKQSKEEKISQSQENKLISKDVKNDSVVNESTPTETKDTKSLKSNVKLNITKQEKSNKKIEDKKSNASLKLQTPINKNVKDISNVEIKNTINMSDKSTNEVEISKIKSKKEKYDEKKEILFSIKTEVRRSLSKTKEEKERNESKARSTSKDEDLVNTKLQKTSIKIMTNTEDEKTKTAPRKKDNKNISKDTVKDSGSVSQQAQENIKGNQKTDKPTTNEISNPKNLKETKEKVSTNASVLRSEPVKGRKTEMNKVQSPSIIRKTSESPKKANIQVRTRTENAKEDFKEPIEKSHRSIQDVQKPIRNLSVEKSPSREHQSKSRSSSMSSEEKFSVSKPTTSQNKTETQGNKVEFYKSPQKSDQEKKTITTKPNTKSIFNQQKETPNTKTKMENENRDSRRSNSQTTNTRIQIENRDSRRSNSQTSNTRIETENKDSRRTDSQSINTKIETENRDSRRANSQSNNTRTETEKRDSRRVTAQVTNTRIETKNRDLQRSNSQTNNTRTETENRDLQRSNSQTINTRIETENRGSRRTNSQTNLKKEVSNASINTKTDKTSARKSEIKESNQSSSTKPTVTVESSTSKDIKAVVQTDTEGNNKMDSNVKNEVKANIKIPTKTSEKKLASKILPLPNKNPQNNQKSVRDTSTEKHKSPVRKIVNKTDILSKTQPKTTPNVKKNESTTEKIENKDSGVEQITNKNTKTQESVKEKEMKDLQSPKDKIENRDSKEKKDEDLAPSKDTSISISNDNLSVENTEKDIQNPLSDEKPVVKEVGEISTISSPTTRMLSKVKRGFNKRSIKNSDKEIESKETSKPHIPTTNATTKTKNLGKETVPNTNINEEIEKEDDVVKVTKDLKGSTLLECSVKLAKKSLEDIRKPIDNEQNDNEIKEGDNKKIEKNIAQLEEEINLKNIKNMPSKLENLDIIEDVDKNKSDAPNSSNPTQTFDVEKTILKSDKIDKISTESNEEISKIDTKPVRELRNLRAKTDFTGNVSPKSKAKTDSCSETTQSVSNPKCLHEDHSRKHKEEEGIDKANIIEGHDPTRRSLRKRGADSPMEEESIDKANMIEGHDPTRRSLRKRGTDSPMESIDAKKIFKEPTNTEIGRKDLNMRIDSPAPAKRSALSMDNIATKSNEDQQLAKRQKLNVRREIRKDLHTETTTSEEIAHAPSPIANELLPGNRKTERISDTSYVRETRSNSSLAVSDTNLSESKEKELPLDITKNIKNLLGNSKKITCAEIETSDKVSSHDSNEEIVPRKVTRSQAASIIEEDKPLNTNVLIENMFSTTLEEQDNSNKKSLRSKITTLDVVKAFEDATLNYADEDTSTASETSTNHKNIDSLIQINEESKPINNDENYKEMSRISQSEESAVTEDLLASTSAKIQISEIGDSKEKLNPTIENNKKLNLSKVSTIKTFSDFEKPKQRIKEIDILRASMPLEMRESGFENMYSEGKLRTKSSLSVVSPVPNERTRVVKNRIMPERPASCISQMKNKSSKHKKESQQPTQQDIFKPKPLKKLRVRINRSVVDKYLKTLNNATEITKKLELNVPSSSTVRSSTRRQERNAKALLPKTTSEAKVEFANTPATSFNTKAVNVASIPKEVVDKRADKTPLLRMSQLNSNSRTKTSEVSKATTSFQQHQTLLQGFHTPTSNHQEGDTNKHLKTDDEDSNLLTPLKPSTFTTLRKEVTEQETISSQQQLPKRLTTLQTQMKDKLKNKLVQNLLKPGLTMQSPVLASLINAKPTLSSPMLTESNKEFTAKEFTTRINALSTATPSTSSTTSSKVVPFIEPKQEIEEYSSIAYNLPSTPTSILSSTTSILPPSHQSTQSPVATLPTITTTGISPTIVDANGTRLYSFLHPAKYNRGYGGVLLDYCCPNLDGPMPAIDPTRIHARTQAVVRELPAYIVMTTKLITRADLETDKNSIPASIRQKVEMLTASSSTPAPSTQVPPALQPLQPPQLSSTINALQRQLPSTTTLTPKNIKALQPVNITDTTPPPLATTSNLKTPVSLPEYQRTLLRASIQRFDLTVTKLFQLNLTKMTFSERQRVVETLSNLNKFSSKDIDCAIRLMDEYMLICNTPSPVIPSLQPTTSLTAAVKTTAPQQKEIVNDNTTARKTKAPRPQHSRKLPIQKQQPQKEQQKNNEQYLPILDADQNIIGFKYQDVSSTSTVTKPTVSTRIEPSTTIPDLRSSTTKNLNLKTSATTKNLKLPAQESPRIFYAKPPLQSSTPIQPKSSNTSLSLRSNQRSCLPYHQFNTQTAATTVTGPPPPKRPAIEAAPLSSLINSTSFGSMSITSPTMTQTTTIASKSMILEPASKRTTRTAAAAAASTTKVIIITSDQQADECILPDDTRSTAIKSENIDEDFIGGN